LTYGSHSVSASRQLTDRSQIRNLLITGSTRRCIQSKTVTSMGVNIMQIRIIDIFFTLSFITFMSKLLTE